jgi:hypothetical protein
MSDKITHTKYKKGRGTGSEAHPTINIGKLFLGKSLKNEI